MSEGFLSRWSKLKRGEAPPPPPDQPVVPAPVAAAPEPVFDVTTLPDLESATAETDFTAFLQKGVPESLKRVALRRAWTLDPAICNFVGPADYAWDFNVEGGVPGFSLQLGGDAVRLLAQAIGQIERVAEALPEAPSFLPPGTSVIMPEESIEAPPEDPLRLVMAEAPVLVPEAEQLPELAPTPRRHGGATPT